MIIQRVGDNIVIKRQGVVDVYVNIIDAVITEWGDGSVGVVSNETHFTYREDYAGITDDSGTPLGSSVQEVISALGDIVNTQDDSGSNGTEFPSPFILSIEGEKIGFNSTADYIIKGGYFTLDTTIEIDGQTVNSIEVMDDDEIKANVTTGSVKGNFDVKINNGKETVKAEAFTVYNLVNIVPAKNDWVRNSNANVDTGSLVPSTTASGWDKGASFGEVPAGKDFELNFNIAYMSGQSSGGYAMIGVDSSDPNTNYNTIDYAIYFSNGTSINIYENGASRGGFGNFTASDDFTIKRDNGVVSYLKNGEVFYTSNTQSTTKMVFDISMYRYLGAQNINLKYTE